MECLGLGKSSSPMDGLATGRSLCTFRVHKNRKEPRSAWGCAESLFFCARSWRRKGKERQGKARQGKAREGKERKEEQARQTSSGNFSIRNQHRNIGWNSPSNHSAARLPALGRAHLGRAADDPSAAWWVDGRFRPEEGGVHVEIG